MDEEPVKPVVPNNPSLSGCAGRLPCRSWLWLVILVSTLAQAAGSAPAGSMDPSALRDVIILHNGRLKPLDTYARTILLQFSGRGEYRGQSAIHWLAGVLFHPAESRGDRVFLIRNHEVLSAMGLSLEQSRRYDYAELSPGLPKLADLAVKVEDIEEKERTAVEAELLRLYGNLTQYINLAACFQFALPSPELSVRDSGLAAYLGVPPAPAELTYFELFSRAGRLHGVLDTLKSKEQSSWTPSEMELLSLTQKLFQWSNFYRNIPFTILPTAVHGELVWLSPWDALNNFPSTPDIQPSIRLLSQAVHHYRNHEQLEFDMAVRAFKQSVAERLPDSPQGVPSITLELFYNALNPFFWLKAGYLLAFLAALSSFVLLEKWLRRIAVGLVLTCLAAHTLGILLRMNIMDRPPVTNLYETFLFVGWISVVLGLAVEYFQRRGTGALVSAVAGWSMMMVASKYAREGDTMGMLVAVLDSNFWLSTHVVTITMGYAGCCAAGVAGHVYVIQRLMGVTGKRLRDSYRAVYGILAFGLVLAFIGTVLGGIWADQSWGRFWGWDPKENGALLIVLWTAALFHARMGGMVREFGLALGAVFGIVVVLFAWFGVNLLGVGLHSYGFTSGIFYRLISFISIEMIFIIAAIIMNYRIRLKEKTI